MKQSFLPRGLLMAIYLFYYKYKCQFFTKIRLYFSVPLTILTIMTNIEVLANKITFFKSVLKQSSKFRRHQVGFRRRDIWIVSHR
jgi:hypothetical protein